MNTNPENSKGNHTNFFSDWLEKLQQESWQLELLISGLALYGIFEAKALLIDLNIYYRHTEGTLHNMVNLLGGMLYTGRLIFLINLLIHVTLRGLWIGAIGLRYVSGDIDYKTLNYSNRFTGYLKKKMGSYDTFIEKLEKICSIIFAYTFLLFLLLLSFISFFGLIVFLVGLLSSAFPIKDFEIYYKTLVYFYYGIGIIVFFDFISLGLLKKVKNKTISRIYFFLYKFVSIVSLSFLYRPLLYNFLDQKFTRRLFFFSIPYIFLVAYGNNLFNNYLYPYLENSSDLQNTGMVITNDYYQDLRDKSLVYIKEKKEQIALIPRIILSEYYMGNSFPSLFIKMETADRYLFKKNKALSPVYEEGVKFTFPSGKSPDVKIDSIMRHKIDSLYNGNNLRKNKKLNLRKKTDSLTNKMGSSVVKPKQDSLSIEEKNYKNIMDAFMGFVDVKIDNISYKDSLFCKYATHPSSGDRGFLCHFNSSSLSMGYHELSFERIYYSMKKKRDSIYKIKLPFIKVK